MPSLNEKPWQTEGNILVTAGTAADANKKVLWTLKALLTGQISSDAAGSTVAGANSKTGLWTVAGSSDSVTAAMDGVDRWGSTFDATKMVWSTASGPRSWICLKSPDALGPYWITLGCTSGTSNVTHMVLDVCKAIPTGVSTNTTNPPSDSWSTALNGQWIENIVGPFRCHLTLNATTGEFWFPVGWGGAIKTVIGVQKIDSATDPYPVVSCLAYSIAGGADGPLGHAGARTSSPMSAVAGAKGLRGRSSLVGAAVADLGALTLWSTSSSLSLPAMQAMTTANADGTWPEAPAYLGGPTWTYIKGRIPDCYWVAPACPEGSVAVDTGGTVYSAVFSDAWLPWTATYLPII